jgi:hypothetical protein
MKDFLFNFFVSMVLICSIGLYIIIFSAFTNLDFIFLNLGLVLIVLLFEFIVRPYLHKKVFKDDEFRGGEVG